MSFWRLLSSCTLHLWVHFPLPLQLPLACLGLLESLFDSLAHVTKVVHTTTFMAFCAKCRTIPLLVALTTKSAIKFRGVFASIKACGFSSIHPHWQDLGWLYPTSSFGPALILFFWPHKGLWHCCQFPLSHLAGDPGSLYCGSQRWIDPSTIHQHHFCIYIQVKLTLDPDM